MMTAMAAWQLDAMKEAQDARAWEALNAPDPAEGRMLEAASSLEVAIKHMKKAADWTQDAAQELKGYPMEDKILSYVVSIETVIENLQVLQEKYRHGDRG